MYKETLLFLTKPESRFMESDVGRPVTWGMVSQGRGYGLSWLWAVMMDV